MRAEAPTTLGPVPCVEWPIWFTAINRLASNQERGVGDSILRTACPIGGEDFENSFNAFIGHTAAMINLVALRVRVMLRPIL